MCRIDINNCQMLRYEALRGSLKINLFCLAAIILTVIYFALTNEYGDLLVNFLDCKLQNIGYFLSVGGPVKFFLKLIIPSYVIVRYFKSSNREDVIIFFKNLYIRITIFQLIICLFIFSIFWFYINKIYMFKKKIKFNNYIFKKKPNTTFKFLKIKIMF